jgi:hypothetical protein
LPDETVNWADPDLPSAVAVIVVEPGDSAVTSPPLETEAICVFVDLYVIVRPVMTLLAASRVTTVACVVCPTSSVLAANVTLTVATPGGVTVSVFDPFLPPIVAVIVVDPAVTPVTRPLDDTLAVAGVELVHETGRPVKAPPFASCAVALS